MQHTKQAEQILKRRYLVKDKETKQPVETIEDMYRRVAKELAMAEGENLREYYENAFFDLMTSHKFLPNSPTLMNGGANNGGTLSGCFVIPIEDSMFESTKGSSTDQVGWAKGIMRAALDSAMVQKFGGGTGFSLSDLRPKGTFIASTQGQACGPILVLKVLDMVSKMITQGGKRNGANMAIMRVDHPDIEEFIHCKDSGDVIENFNISVAITDDFLTALREDKDFRLHWDNDKHDLHVEKYVNARKLWKDIIHSAWKTGDPGLWYIDRTNNSKANPVPSMGPIKSTNPCGEQPLYSYDSCNLGSINLSKFVDPNGFINFEEYKRTIDLAIRLLDDVVSRNNFPEDVPEISHVNKLLRRTGLGPMGWADMLVKMKIPYDSDRALDVARRVMKTMSDEAFLTSVKLGAEKGAFGAFEDSIYFKENPLRLVRNSARTTIAPTGTISLIANCSQGIEPYFAIAYYHRGLNGEIQDMFVNDLFKQALIESEFSENYINETVIPAVIANNGSCRGLPYTIVPKQVQDIFPTAHDVTPEWHVKMQAAFQEFTDNAVSKTVNLPHSSTEEDVEKVYNLSIELGCKGVTIYRDGSKDNQVLYVNKKEEEEVLLDITEGTRARPKNLKSITIKQESPFGNMYITITEMQPDDPFEVFANIGKAGSDVQAMTEAVCRMISQFLRLESGVSRFDRLEIVREQLNNIGGMSSSGFGPSKTRSIPDAISKAIASYIRGGDVVQEHGIFNDEWPKAEVVQRNYYNSGAICPDCGQTKVYMAEGCMTCQECGWSQC